MQLIRKKNNLVDHRAGTADESIERKKRVNPFDQLC
jgi:hypothetical protein